MTCDPAARARAVAWQQHLREGGTTRWGDFSGASMSDAAVASAVHLELLRRLDSSLPQFSTLADLVLTTPAPGRGSVDVPLAGSTTNPYGAPPVDPSELAPAEMTRVAVGVLDRLIGTPAATPRPGSGMKLLPRRHFQVSGTPVACQVARAALLGAGWREHPRRARQFVFGAPLPDAAAQLWSDRVARGATTSWPELWKRLAAADELPRRLRFEELVRASGRRAVPVFGTLEDVTRHLERDFGLRVESPLVPLDLVATSLTRGLNAVLATRMDRGQRRRATPVIAGVVGRSDVPVTALRVPRSHQHWANVQQQDEPDYPRVASMRLPGRVPEEHILGLAIAAIGRGWMRHVKEGD